MKPSGANWGGAYDHITNEFIHAELAKGKSVAQFEREQGMPRGVARKLFASRGIRRHTMYAEKLIGNHRTPIRRAEIETEKANGPVTTYFLPLDEIERIFKDIKPLKEKPPIEMPNLYKKHHEKRR